jgi:DUF1680 family protein
LENGTGLTLVQQTKYPWDGDISLKISPAKAATFTLYLRIPGWASKATVTLDGKPAPGKPKPGDYFAIRREWKAASTVRLQLDMTPHLVAANPLVREDYGRVAVQRGPLLYCLEQVDQEDRGSVFDVVLPAGPDPSLGFASEFRPDMLGGIVVLKHKGMATPKPLSEEPLYRTLERAPRSQEKEVDLTFIPYYAWANRLPGAMEVWIPYGTGGKVAVAKGTTAPRTDAGPRP